MLKKLITRVVILLFFFSYHRLGFMNPLFVEPSCCVVESTKRSTEVKMKSNISIMLNHSSR